MEIKTESFAVLHFKDGKKKCYTSEKKNVIHQMLYNSFSPVYLFNSQ